MTETTLESLQPSTVWEFFRGLARVPRPSKREEKIRAHILEVAAKLGLEAVEEPVGNIIIRVPASAGAESAPVTVLQAHLDMVCEKNEGTAHDFDEDPIQLLCDRDAAGDEIVRAAGTTLGADNGIGVAMALAAASSPDVVHGPLELLFTIDEESGMTGAKALQPTSFEGRRLINLDSEEDDCIYIGCAGGRDTDMRWEFRASAPAADLAGCVVSVSGLRGGHSGCDIHENRGNAIKLLARTLAAGDAHERLLAELRGGSMRNAIPREATARLATTPVGMEALVKAAAAIQAAGRAESMESELVIEVTAVSVEALGVVASSADTQTLVAALEAVPSGVVAMHPQIPELVETSNNLSTAKSNTEDGRLQVSVGCLTRGSMMSSIDSVTAQLAAVVRLSGGTARHGNGYPGWQPNVDSELLATTRALYEELFSEKPKVAAIHAGLECGIIRDAVGEMDMVSFGPRIEGAHSPDERVYPESVQKSWRFLVAVLEKLSR